MQIMQELLDATHHILAELEKEHKAQKAPGVNAEAIKPDADADELREKFRIVRVSAMPTSWPGNAHCVAYHARIAAHKATSPPSCLQQRTLFKMMAELCGAASRQT